MATGDVVTLSNGWTTTTYIYIYTLHAYTYIPTYIHTYIPTYIHTYIYIYIFINAHSNTCTYIQKTRLPPIFPV